MLTLYDANNYARRVLETDPTGFGPRTIVSEVFRSSCPVIWVWDSPDGSRTRKSIYPGYKKNRGPLDRTIFDGFRIIEEVLKFSPAIQVKVPGFEADDVIATLTRQYASKGEKIIIQSNDWDFAQLSAEFPNRVVGYWQPKPDVPNNLVKLYKICVGDPADCIPGIPGFGRDTWKKCDKRLLQSLIQRILRSGEVPEQNLLPKRVKLNASWIRLMSQIVNFFSVPKSLIDHYSKAGDPNFRAADTFLRNFYQ